MELKIDKILKSSNKFVSNFINELSNELEKSSNLNHQTNLKMKNKELENGQIYAVDRIVENVAVLENRETGKTINVNKNELPNEVSEGTILKFDDGKFEIDEDLQSSIEKEIKQKMNDVWEN